MSVVANVAINVDATKALGQLKAVDQASKSLDGGLKNAAVGANGFGAALKSALGPLLAISTAVAAVQKGLEVAFERGGAEQRLKNLTNSTGEYKAALAAAASTSEKFGISQTEATTALADVYGRLKGVGFGLKETTQIYQGFNVIAKQSGLAAADAAGVFFQLSQALGKGKLNGDEFVAVAERMPGLLDAIAKETGRSRGELAGMAQQGKITSDVLYKALAGSASAAGDLNGKLTDQQKAFNNLGRVTDDLLNSIGKIFAPFVVKGAELLAAAGQKLSEWWNYLGSNVLPRVLKALQPAIKAFQELWTKIPWGTIIGYIQSGIVLGVNQLIKAIEFLSPLIGFVVTKFVQLAQNPVFKFIAEQVGNVLNLLGLSSQEVSNFTAEQNKSQEAAAATVNQYSSMPEKIQTAVEANKSMIESTNQVLQNITQQQQSIESQVTSLERGASINSARYEVEKSINDLQGQQLEREYNLQTTAQGRLDIAIALFQNAVQAAKIEYNQALEKIKLDERKLALQVESAALKYKEIEAEGQLQILKSKDAEAAAEKKRQLDKALASQREVITATQAQASSQQEISKYQQQSAGVQYQSKVLAAQTALETKLTSANIGLSQSEALGLSQRLGQSASSAISLSSNTQQVSNNAAAAASNFIRVATAADQAATSIGNAARAQQSLNNAKSNSGGSSGSVSVKKAAEGAFWPGGFKAFAKGGVVTKPTMGLIGEGGEDEYIIPQSKAAGFAANYLSGARGAAAIPSGGGGGASPTISIQTGPVTQMNGTNYVSTQDLSRAVQAGVQQTMTLLRNDRGTRRMVGLA